jgi:NitT/TauT family transport system substrate-binding protein
MTRRYRALVVAALATALAVAAGGCSGDDGGSDASSGNKPADKVSYITAFGAVGRDAMAWVAQEKGFFRDAGFEVTIQLGAGTDTNLKALTAGQVQFASLDLTGIIIQAGKGAFKDVRAVATVHQQTLVSIVSLEGGKVTAPKDLEGKKLGAATGSVNQLLFPAYASLAGFDASKVTWVNTQPAQVPALLASGQVDAVSTFLIGRGGIEKAAGGKKAVVLPYSDYLKDLFGNMIVTTAAVADGKPEMTLRFRDAMLKALKYTIDNPQEAAEIMNKAQKAADVGAAVSEIKLMTPYVTSGAGIFGAIDEQRVSRAIAILQGAGLIPAGLTADQVVDFDLTPKA